MTTLALANLLLGERDSLPIIILSAFPHFMGGYMSILFYRYFDIKWYGQIVPEFIFDYNSP